jgi:hypothetical protein
VIKGVDLMVATGCMKPGPGDIAGNDVGIAVGVIKGVARG